MFNILLARTKIKRLSKSDRIKKRSELYKKQKCRCYWCGGYMLPYSITKGFHPRVFTLEHIKRLAEGGDWSNDNLALAHKSCNESRHRI